MDILYVVMPAYNEEANIEGVVRSWLPILEEEGILHEKSRLVIADSGSTDATHTILMGLAKEFSQLEILSNTGKQHGPKLMALYDYAIKNKVGYVFQTDSDGQTNPEEFGAFWKLRDQYDGIFGHRNVRGDGKSRAFVERVVCLLVRMFFGVSVPDANAPFRLMKVAVLERYLHKLPNDYSLPNIMMAVYFAHYKERIIFKTITFKPRQGGINSINIPKIVKIGWKTLWDFKEFKKGMKQ